MELKIKRLYQFGSRVNESRCDMGTNSTSGIKSWEPI